MMRNLKLIPEAPGVYLFWDGKEPIYIGKAINLKKRLDSYFSTNLSVKTSQMLKETKTFSFIKVGSELEALLLEAKLVKKTKPKYNTQLKDDKHPLYIKIVNEDYPRVLTARKIEEKEENLAFFGPFPQANHVRFVLKTLRKIFPYSTHKVGKRPCLESQIGLCRPCPSEIEKIKNRAVKERMRKEYLKNVKFIRTLLSGKLKSVRERLERKMIKLSRDEKFEKAAEIRDKIKRLDYITQPVIPADKFVDNPNLIEDIREDELKALRKVIKKHLKIPKRLMRIECFDVAHLAGVHPTASMVTFINGEADKTYYRHFKIGQKKGQDDIASMMEVAKRRERHLVGWGVPDLIVVDGGKTQVSSFLPFFKKHQIPVIGITKKKERLIIPTKGSFKEVSLTGPSLNLIQRLRNEAHRFARRYHHKLWQKSLIP